ncbi:GntR family transcriptional regulator [Egicoccus sp. AB-alg2]|uniref:GntR family transcriptional regulator n=1 Tax=Egicoccus sp. AB-alg2 TaxID=3242693 RepID=UPI00359E1E89
MTTDAASPLVTGAPASLDRLTVLVPEDAATASLSEQAYYVLRDRIVTLQLAPGTLVNERTLMAETGFGRTPIREALRRLADEDLVEVHPRRAIHVTPVDVGDLRAISELRVELEGFVARLAARRGNERDRTDLARLLEETSGTDGAAAQRDLIELDQRIHRVIRRAAHNPFLEAALDRSYVLALRLWFLALDRVPRLEDAVHEHEQLLRAILAGEADAAEAIARDHVAGFEHQIRQLL